MWAVRDRLARPWSAGTPCEVPCRTCVHGRGSNSLRRLHSADSPNGMVNHSRHSPVTGCHLQAGAGGLTTPRLVLATGPIVVAGFLLLHLSEHSVRGLASGRHCPVGAESVILHRCCHICRQGGFAGWLCLAMHGGGGGGSAQAVKEAIENQISMHSWTTGPWSDAKLDFDGFYVGRLARPALSRSPGSDFQRLFDLASALGPVVCSLFHPLRPASYDCGCCSPWMTTVAIPLDSCPSTLLVQQEGCQQNQRTSLHVRRALFRDVRNAPSGTGCIVGHGAWGLGGWWQGGGRGEHCACDCGHCPCWIDCSPLHSSPPVL